MSNRPVELIPPDHEQSNPTFLVQRHCADAFLDHLRANDITVIEPPDDLGELGSSQTETIQIEVDSLNDLDALEAVQGSFSPNSSTK